MNSDMIISLCVGFVLGYLVSLLIPFWLVILIIVAAVGAYLIFGHGRERA